MESTTSLSSVPQSGSDTAKKRLARALALDLTHSQRRYALVVIPYVVDGLHWLEVGCGREIFRPWLVSDAEQSKLVSRCASVVGMDVDDAIIDHRLLTAKVKALAGGTLPFKKGIFDLVTANMVVEHVDDPLSFLADMRDVLKPGGRFIFHTPNFQHYLIFMASLIPDGIKGRIVKFLDGRDTKDVFPTRYQMNTVRRIRSLAAASGFEVEQLKVVGSGGFFGRLGPLGLLECFLMKGLSVFAHGRFNSNIICVLRKPIPSH